MDRWSFRPAIISVAVVAFVMFFCQLPGLVSFILIPLSLIVYAAAALALIAAAIYLAVKKRPRRAASLMLAIVVPIALWIPIIRAEDYLHLPLTVWFGAGVLGGPLNQSEKGFATYDWSVGLAGSPNTILIRDESDQIALPPAQAKNLSSLAKRVSGWCDGNTRHLLGHYYVCDF